jgi:hypothetical protein
MMSNLIRNRAEAWAAILATLVLIGAIAVICGAVIGERSPRTCPIDHEIRTPTATVCTDHRVNFSDGSQP